MAVPTSYTESSFADFLHSELGDTATLLGWSTSSPNSYEEITNDTLLEMGETDITNIGASDIKKLRTLGRWQAWEAAAAGLVGEINYSADGAKFDREAIYQHAKQQAQRWQTQAMEYSDVYTVAFDTISYPVASDPYAPLGDE